MAESVHIVDSGSGSRFGTQAVERALSLLGLIADEPLTTTQVGEKALLPRSTVLRLLAALERHGYILRANTTWSLGPTLLEVTSRQNSHRGLTGVSRPYLQTLVERFEETAFLCVREGIDSLCVDKVEGSRQMRFTTSVGSRTPLHAGATGRTLLAFAPAAVREAVLSRPLKRFTIRTITDPTTLRRSLKEIRQLGYGYSDGEIDEGAFAVAAPVWAGADRALGVIAVAGPSTRMSPSIRQSLSEAVSDNARLLSDELSPLDRRAGARKEER